MAAVPTATIMLEGERGSGHGGRVNTPLIGRNLWRYSDEGGSASDYAEPSASDRLRYEGQRRAQATSPT
jgi:hypothetical protein